MLDVRRCRNVAVYASVGDGMYGGYESGGGFCYGMVESRVEGYVGLGIYGVRGRKGRGFLGGIGIEYGIRLVVMIELEKIVKMERKEEGIM